VRKGALGTMLAPRSMNLGVPLVGQHNTVATEFPSLSPARSRNMEQGKPFTLFGELER
jgi:hypothetical protein